MTFGALGWLATAPCVFAQDAVPAPSDTPASDTQKPAGNDKDAINVTVKGQKKPIKPADRDVYDVSQDPTTKTGTIADTLNKIPGVLVDATGRLTLHGKPATLLVDGRPSLILSGDNQGAALRAMPSSFISSVEVMTAPGAQYSSEGSGGIINLVTNRNLPAGGMMSVNAEAQSSGGGNADLSGSYHIGKLTIEGDLGRRADFSQSRSASTFSSVGNDGTINQETRTAGTSNNVSRSLAASGRVQYDLTHDDIFSGKFQIFNNGYASHGASRSDSFGQTTNIFTSTNMNRGGIDNGSVVFDWVHYGQEPDEKLTISTSLAHASSNAAVGAVDTYVLSSLAGNTGDRTTTTQNESRNDAAVFQVDYAGPVWDDQLHMGLEIHSDRNRAHDVTHTPEPLTATGGIIPLTDSRFNYHQVLSAAYVTYQKEFGDRWTILGGLRAETLDLDTNFISLSARGHLLYTRLNPTVYVTYVISKKASLRLDYTRRLQRPEPHDLNPYVVLTSLTTVTAGNPNLKPQDTDIYEARYSYSDRSLNLTLRGFYNRDEHLIAPSSRFIPDPQNAGNQVLETTSLNYGFKTDTGLEVSYSNQFWGKLFVTLDTSLHRFALRNPDIVGTRSGTSLDNMLSVSGNLTSKTTLSISYNGQGRQPTGQGYTSGFTYNTVSLTHPLPANLSLTFSISDPLRAQKFTTVWDTANVHGATANSQVAPVFMISLNRYFAHYGK